MAQSPYDFNVKSLVPLHEPGVYIYERDEAGYYYFKQLVPGDTITITVNQVTVAGQKVE